MFDNVISVQAAQDAVQQVAESSKEATSTGERKSLQIKRVWRLNAAVQKLRYTWMCTISQIFKVYFSLCILCYAFYCMLCLNVFNQKFDCIVFAYIYQFICMLYHEECVNTSLKALSVSVSVSVYVYIYTNSCWGGIQTNTVCYRHSCRESIRHH